jgi:hypothetical protein
MNNLKLLIKTCNLPYKIFLSIYTKLSNLTISENLLFDKGLLKDNTFEKISKSLDAIN